nr:hypothetical protein BaRGS_012613 [Batillaria attramentaria]
MGIPAYDVVTIVDPPYVLPKNATGQHDGYIVELLALVAKQASFKYNLSVVSGTYGHQEPDGTWAGLIGKLQLSNAEDGMGEGLLLLMPFTASTWTLISLAFILVSVGLFLIGRYSPCEWSRVSAENDVRRARYSFGYREAPKSLSGRVVAVSWWCFTLSILVAYTCNLTALVMSRPDRQPALSFRTYEDILRDRSIDVGIPCGALTEHVRASWEHRTTDLQSVITCGHRAVLVGSTQDNRASLVRSSMRSSDVDLILRGSSENMATQMYEYVRSRHNWVRDLGEGLERMRDSQGKFALLLPSYTAEYLALRNCDLITYGNSLDPISYAFAFTLGDRGSKFVVMGPRDLAVPFLFLFLCGLVAGLVFTLEILHSKGQFDQLLQRPEQEGEAAQPLKCQARVPPTRSQPAVYTEESEDPGKGDKFGEEGEDGMADVELEPEEKNKEQTSADVSGEYVTIEKEEEQEDNKPTE